MDQFGSCLKGVMVRDVEKEEAKVRSSTVMVLY